MEVQFWGTRGSIPTPGLETVRYGGNTTCLEIRHKDDFIIIDAGTGIRALGNKLLRERGSTSDVHLLITHTHWDHIQGLPFFLPAFIKGKKLRIFGPHNHQSSFDKVLADQMQFSYFPVNFSQLQADISPRTLHELESFEIGSIKVTPKYVNHPVPTLAYRMESDGKSITFMTDVEPYRDILYGGVCPSEDEREEFEDVQAAVREQNQQIVDFAKGSDILIMDAQYTKEEYLNGRVGWGHTSIEDAIDIGIAAGVTQLLLFHHDPDRTDEQLEALVNLHRERLSEMPNCPIEFLDGAEEGKTFVA